VNPQTGTSTPATPAIVRRRVVVAGRVQAVGYRASCHHRAAGAGLGGWVRNLPDGRVEAAFEGPAAVVELLVGWCRDGPPLARVTAVAVADEPLTGETGFQIR
jgi:acylphosphatase